MATPVEERRTLPPRINQRRFIGSFVALGLVLIAAIVLTVLLAERAAPRPWTTATVATPDDPVERAQAVAAFVQGRYRNDGGDPLLQVSTGEDLITDLPGRDQVVALAGSENGAPWSFEPGDLLFFKLCGPAADCAFDIRPEMLPGQTFALATQQAKELALRGLTNVHEAESAIVIMPQGVLQAAPGESPQTVVYYWRRSDLKSGLDNPLAAEFETPAPRPNALSEEQAGRIIAPEEARLFTMVAKPAPDNAAMIYELTPPRRE